MEGSVMLGSVRNMAKSLKSLGFEQLLKSLQYLKADQTSSDKPTRPRSKTQRPKCPCRVRLFPYSRGPTSGLSRPAHSAF